MPPPPTETVLDAPRVESDSSTVADEKTSMRYLAFGVLLAAMVFFVVVNAAQFTAPFGDSHDGRNAGVWAAGSRALREEGPIGSRFGGIHLDGSPYANHPPLIYVETALSESILGEHAWASKLPALLSTLATALLLYLLLRDAGLRSLTAATGASIGLLTPMVLTYGSMLDTPMTSLAFGVGMLVVWQRQRQGRPPPTWLVVAVASLACLAGWEATLLTWLAAADILWRSRGRNRGRAPWALAVGALVGTALTIGWATWVYGDLSTLYDQLIKRSSGDTLASRSGALRLQAHWMAQLFAADLLGLVACAVAVVVDRKFRPLAAIALIATIAYPVVLYNGAYYHDYWNYWITLPIALGAGWALNEIWSSMSRRGASPYLAAGTALAIGLVVCIPPLRTPPPEAHTLAAGTAAGRVAAAGHYAPSQDQVADIGLTYEASDWLGYYARLPEQHQFDPKVFLAFAAAHPTAQVLVSNSCAPLPTGILCQAVAENGQVNTDPVRWYMASAAVLAERYRQNAPRLSAKKGTS